MDQYNRMGIPTIKRKKLHFKSIEFFKFHKELLPPILKKEIEQKDAQSPTKVSMQKSKEALEGNPALKFMLPKQSRE